MSRINLRILVGHREAARAAGFNGGRRGREAPRSGGRRRGRGEVDFPRVRPTAVALGSETPDALGAGSDVVHRRAGLARLALDDVGDRGAREHLARGAAAASAKTPSASAPSGPSSSSTISSTVISPGSRAKRVAALDAALGVQHARRGAASRTAARGTAPGSSRRRASSPIGTGPASPDCGRARRAPAARTGDLVVIEIIALRSYGDASASQPSTRRHGPRARAYSQPRSVAIRTAWARSTAPSLP